MSKRSAESARLDEASGEGWQPPRLFKRQRRRDTRAVPLVRPLPRADAASSANPDDGEAFSGPMEDSGLAESSADHGDRKVMEEAADLGLIAEGDGSQAAEAGPRSRELRQHALDQAAGLLSEDDTAEAGADHVIVVGGFE